MILSTLSLPDGLSPIIAALLAISGISGLIALISPRLFSKLAGGANHWVDTARILAPLDTRVDIDSHILPHSRLLGAAVLLAVGVLSFMLSF